MIGKKSLVNVWGLSATAAALVMGVGTAYGQTPSPAQVDDLTKGGGPLGRGFIENAGQWNSKARYYTSAGATRVWVTDSSVVYDFFQQKSDKKGTMPRENGHVVSMEFQGVSSKAGAVPGKDLHRNINYITGKGTFHARSFDGARISNLYDGVDLQLSKEGNNPRFDLIVAPGKDISNLLVNYRGANGLKQNKDGTLTLGTSVGSKQIAQLRAYQIVNGAKQQVSVSFDLHSDGMVGFKVGKHDLTKGLTIDPVIYSTLMGDNGFYFTQAFAVAVDQNSSPVMTGFTRAPDFPVTVGAYNDVPGPGISEFISKFAPDGQTLLWSTVINSTNTAFGMFAQLDSNARVIIAGYAGPNYPVTATAVQTTVPSGDTFAPFLSVLSADGSTLQYSTYYGGGFNLPRVGGFVNGERLGDVQNIGDDPRTWSRYATLYGNQAFGLLNLGVDSQNRIYLMGQGTITPTKNALQSTNGGDSTYVGCFNSNGSVAFASYFTFPNTQTFGAAVGPDGGIYFCGGTSNEGIPATQGAFQTINRGEDGYVSKINPVLSSTSKMTIGFTTYIGGSGSDDCMQVTVDSLGEPYVWGDSNSIDFPLTQGAFATGSGGDSFVAKFDGAGAHLIYATYTATSGPLFTWIATDPSGNCYLTGAVNTEIPYVGIPVTGNADQSAMVAYNPTEPFNPTTDTHVTQPPFVTPGDAFLEVINATGTGLIYSGFWGGTYDDQAEQVTIDAGGNCYMVGWTDSFVANAQAVSVEFPTYRAFDNTYFRTLPTTTPPNFYPPYLFWNDANEPGNSTFNGGGPVPMGFLTKFRVTDTIFLTGVNVPSVIPGGLSGNGVVDVSAAPAINNIVPIEFISNNQSLIPSFEVDFQNPQGNPPQYLTTFPFGIQSSDVTVETSLTLTAYHDGVYIVSGVSVVPLLQSFSVAVPQIVGGNATTAAVTLAETVPHGFTDAQGAYHPYWVEIKVSSTDETKAYPTAPTFKIYSDTDSALIGVKTVGVDAATTVNFTGQVVGTFLPNTNQQTFAYRPTAPLTILPASVQQVTFVPQIVLGGYPSVGNVVLNGQAGPTPITVNLSESTGTANVTLSPTSLTIPYGKNSAAFNAQTKAVYGDSFKTVIATQLNNKATATGTIFVNPITIGAFQLVTPTVTGGSYATAYITLSAAAPAGGVTVVVQSSNSKIGILPSNTITVPAGSSKSATFEIRTPLTSSEEIVDLTATDGSLNAQTTLTVLPEALTFTSQQTSVEGGVGNFNFTLGLARSEQNDAVPVTLTSNGGSYLQIPGSVSIPAETTSISFNGTTNVVSSAKTVTVTATTPSLQGTISKTVTVTINPLPLVVNVVPQNLIGGVTNGTGTVVLNAPATATTVVTLNSNNTTAAYPSPSSISIAKGSQTKQFSVITNQVAQQTPVTITASDSAGSNTTTFTVDPPSVTLTKLAIANSSVLGGGSTTGTLTFTGTIPRGGLAVNLSSSNTSAAQVNPTVTIPQNATSVSFPITTSPVSNDTPVTITAGYGASSVSASMTVVAARIGTITIKPTSVTGGSPVALIASINLPAPPGGVVVQISQSSSLLTGSGGILLNGQQPIGLTGSSGPFPTVTIPYGKTSVQVTITTPAVSRQIGTTITGTFGSYSTASATLLINPS